MMSTGSPDVNRGSARPLWVRLLALTAIGSFVALLAYGLAGRAPDTDIDQALSRSRPAAAPDVDLPLLQRGVPGPRLAPVLRPALADGRVRLTELEGHPVVLNYWASWCVPCRTEAPLLERAWKQRRGDGVVLLGLNMQDVTTDARGFIGEFGISYPNIRDKSNEVATDWGVTGLPETFFLDRRGRVVAHVIGALSDARLRSGVKAAVRGQPLGSLQGGDRRTTR
ncbi:MAG: TlpA disulfide reductase family protein [Gammaproteobacteria bacterium]